MKVVLMSIIKIIIIKNRLLKLKKILKGKIQDWTNKSFLITKSLSANFE